MKPVLVVLMVVCVALAGCRGERYPSCSFDSPGSYKLIDGDRRAVVDLDDLRPLTVTLQAYDVNAHTVTMHSQGGPGTGILEPRVELTGLNLSHESITFDTAFGADAPGKYAVWIDIGLIHRQEPGTPGNVTLGVHVASGCKFLYLVE